MRGWTAIAVCGSCSVIERVALGDHPGPRAPCYYVCVFLAQPALPTDAMRPDDHAAIVGMDPLPYHRTVGAIGIVFATTPTVIVPRPDAKSEWANLNACTIRVHASINLSRGGNGPNEQRAGGHSQEQVPHNILLLTLRTQRFSRADVAPAKKFLRSWNHGLFLCLRRSRCRESSALRPLRQSRR